MTLLMVQNVAILIMNISKYFESVLFYSHSLEKYSFSHSLMLLICQLIILVPLFFYEKKIYTTALSTKHNQTIWRYLWIIPGTFYLLWQYFLFLHRDIPSLNFSYRTIMAVMLALLNAGSFVIYHITASLLLEKERSETYAVQNRTMRFQYENIQERIAEAKKNRHDIRHHLVLIDRYLQDEKYDACKEYLEKYRSSLPFEESLTYCEHYATNALLTYLVQRGKEYGITSEINVLFPKELPYPEEDLTVVFANLLENALHASQEYPETYPDHKTIVKIQGIYEAGLLAFTVENPTVRLAKQNINGIFQSSKHEGSGIGISSVKSIAEKYQSSLKIIQTKGIFTANVILHAE